MGWKLRSCRWITSISFLLHSWHLEGPETFERNIRVGALRAAMQWVSGERMIRDSKKHAEPLRTKSLHLLKQISLFSWGERSFKTYFDSCSAEAACRRCCRTDLSHESHASCLRVCPNLFARESPPHNLTGLRRWWFFSRFGKKLIVFQTGRGDVFISGEAALLLDLYSASCADLQKLALTCAAITRSFSFGTFSSRLPSIWDSL